MDVARSSDRILLKLGVLYYEFSYLVKLQTRDTREDWTTRLHPSGWILSYCTAQAGSSLTALLRLDPFLLH